MSNKIHVKGFDCKTSEEILFNLFNLKPGTRVIFVKIINIFLINNGFSEISIDDNIGLQNFLEQLIKNKKTRDDFFTLILNNTKKIEGGEVLKDVIDLFNNTIDKDDTFETIQKHFKDLISEKIYDILDISREDENKTKNQLFDNIEGINIKNGNKITYNQLKKLLVFSNINSIMEIYSILRDEDDLIQQQDKDKLNTSICKVLEITEAEFKSIDLEQFLENGTEFIVLKAIHEGWITEVEFKKILQSNQDKKIIFGLKDIQKKLVMNNAISNYRKWMKGNY